MSDKKESKEKREKVQKTEKNISSFSKFYNGGRQFLLSISLFWKTMSKRSKYQLHQTRNKWKASIWYPFYLLPILYCECVFNNFVPSKLLASFSSSLDCCLWPFRPCRPCRPHFGTHLTRLLTCHYIHDFRVFFCMFCEFFFYHTFSLTSIC